MAQIKGETERDLASVGSLPKCARLKPGAQDVISVPPRSDKGPRTQTVFSCFPWYFSRKLFGKWSSGDLNGHLIWA